MGSVRTAIAGLGLTELGKVYGKTPDEFAAQAVRSAASDAGLHLADLDGLLVSGGTAGGVTPGLQKIIGLRDLRLLSQLEAYGSTAISMVQFASLAIQAGMATVVACVWADCPLRQDVGFCLPAAAAAHGFRQHRLCERAGRREPRLRARRPPPHGCIRHHTR